MKTGVLFVNFGGPTQDDELEPFLFNLLSDVLPGPGWLSKAVAGRLAPLRARKVRDVYREIGWSPLVADSHKQAEGAMALARHGDTPWALGMMFSQPTMAQGIQKLRSQGVERLLVVGLFPHYSFATAGSAYDLVHHALEDAGVGHMPVHYAKVFFDEPSYLDALASTIRQGAASVPGEGPIDLLFSAHGVPLSFIRKGDPYPEHVRESVRRVIRHMGWTDPWHLAWQSRLGPVKWLAPATPDTIDQLAASGCKRLVMVPVSFVGEHIETLDEIDREYRDHAVKAGIPHFGRAPALGMEPRFLQCLADLVDEAMDGFSRYTCARCLIPKPEAHRRKKQCDNCKFVFPDYLRHGVA